MNSLVIRKVFLFLPFYLLMLCSTVLAADYRRATYYVSPSGSDSNSGLETTAPFKTIQKAADLVNPGDTVIVRDGTYTTNGTIMVNMTRSGNASNWITFKSENKWGAKLDCQNNATDFGINIGNISYVRIEDLEVYGCEWGGFWSNSNANHIYFYGNKIHDIGRVYESSAYGKAGIFQGGGTSYHTYDSNLFYTIGRLDSGNLVDWVHDHGIYAYGHDITIINNIFYDQNAGWDIQISGGCGNDGPNWLVANNTFASHNTHVYGQVIIWTVDSCTPPETPQHPTNVIVDNNIFYNPPKNYAYNSYWESGSSSWYFRNNIVYGASHLVLGPQGRSSTYNESATKYADPLFVDPDGRNYHLQATSPAINAGVPTAGRTKDMDGKAIVGVPDIGPYEF